ncbi:hypothetical protein [Chroococcidiopsis sp.]|uniref:hypothetical protein n=1 Tax=Chroococcidiopsis sp. TaxID=3088168 RepID=UPI003F6643B6
MEYSEVLQRMAEYAKELTLLNMIRETIRFVKNHQNLYFSDVLVALAEYAEIESNKETENPNWKLVSSLLATAAEKLDSTQLERRSATIDLQVAEGITNYYHRSILLGMIEVWTRTLEQQKCRFSEILRALSNYAHKEAEDQQTDDAAWLVVAKIIDSAAAAAEQKGSELP